MPFTDSTHVTCGYDEVVFVSGHTKVAPHVFMSDPCPTCGTVEFVQRTASSSTTIAALATDASVTDATGFPTEPDLAP